MGVKEGPGARERASDRRPAWPMLLLLLLAAVTTSLSAVALSQLLALRADVDALRSELCRRREEQQEGAHTTQTLEQMGSRRGGPEQAGQSEAVAPGPRKRRGASGGPTADPVSQPCLQIMADSSKNMFQKEFAEVLHSAIPWQAGLRRGSALELVDNQIVVREEGFYFVYSQAQVYYVDRTFVMGHVVVRRKSTVVGDEPQEVVLFRCIQQMNASNAYNTCFTGGIVRLEVNDLLEVLIPLPVANISLGGANTFLGVMKLA
ncbi:tumor necrosis factor ligand superfamily member 13B isoform X1 [Gadus macrocephalus]|uniref:tumor necrosis factor ligand superfamily member 13B isoform X1 n=1 Tax=Gadus macrocephalus TaxID=80720 RepID=UPI0028CB371A|nr:tumor necrosis factor ligand superfamily member 13B isoform X1 [Gadus macrocephalus]